MKCLIEAGVMEYWSFGVLNFYTQELLIGMIQNLPSMDKDYIVF